MNKLILYPLIILMFVGAYYQLINSQSYVGFSMTSSASYSASGEQILGETTNVLTQEATYQIYGINVMTGFVIFITVFVIIGVLAGIKVLGSGLSTYSVMLIHKSAVYWGLWTIFSSFSLASFLSIPLFGAFMWFLLTLLYAVGFFQTLGSSGDED